MVCDKAAEMISLYMDNMLDEEKKAEFEEHINSCEDCRASYEDILVIMKACAEIEEEELPEGFRDELHQKLLNVSKNMVSPFININSLYRNRYFRIITSVAAAFVIIFAVWVAFIKGGHPAGNANISMKSAEGIETTGSGEMALSDQPGVLADESGDYDAYINNADGLSGTATQDDERYLDQEKGNKASMATGKIKVSSHSSVQSGNKLADASTGAGKSKALSGEILKDSSESPGTAGLPGYEPDAAREIPENDGGKIFVKILSEPETGATEYALTETAPDEAIETNPASGAAPGTTGETEYYSHVSAPSSFPPRGITDFGATSRYGSQLINKETSGEAEFHLVSSDAVSQSTAIIYLANFLGGTVYDSSEQVKSGILSKDVSSGEKNAITLSLPNSRYNEFKNLLRKLTGPNNFKILKENTRGNTSHIIIKIYIIES